MNKIVDRSEDTDDITQPQSSSTGISPEQPETPNEAAAHVGDSIVTYHSDHSAELANATTDMRPEHEINVPSESAAAPQHTPSELKTLLPKLMLFAIIGLSVAGGFMLGQLSGSARADLAVASASLSQTSFDSGLGINQPNPSSVADAQAQATVLQSEITKQLGLMRAELLRLHAVFVRLTEIAELDDGEFDLESPLLDWQEQSSVQKIGLLNRRIAHMSDSSGTLGSIFDLRRMAYDQKISGKPLVEGYRTSGFGYRTDPITGERLEHQGLDFSGPVGEPILALADGIVTFSGKNSGYGNLVELEHVDGLRTRYAHNQANLVKRGARVKKGQAIATLGSTGRSTGPHVHIEVRLDGSPIDPGFFVR